MFVTGVFGLIIAFCNVLTLLLLVYQLLLVIDDERSRLYRGLGRVFSPVLGPLRRVLPSWRMDFSPIIMAFLVQAVSAIVRKVW